MSESIPPSELGPILTSAGAQIASQKYAIIACYTVFVYDYFLTLNDEISFIWRRQLSLVTLAYIINRYYAFVTFTLQVIANFDVAIDTSMCKLFIPWQAYGEGIPLSVATNIVIGLRVYALYKRNVWILLVLSVYVIAEVGISLWTYLTPSIHPVTLPGPARTNMIPVLHLCLVSTSSRISDFESAIFPFMQAIFDSVAFGMIVYMTVDAIIRNHGLHGIRALIIKHGVLYYAVVCSAFLTWAMMIIFSPSGLKYAAAAPSVIMTCVSVNRLTLSLRSYYEVEERKTVPTSSTQDFVIGNSVLDIRHRKRRRSWVGMSTFEVTDFDQLSMDTERRQDMFELHDLPSSRQEA